MQIFNDIELKGTQAVRRLRLSKLKNGYPFMINTKELASNQCYFEYPDGSIKLVALESASRKFQVVKILSPKESLEVRSKFDLTPMNF